MAPANKRRLPRSVVETATRRAREGRTGAGDAREGSVVTTRDENEPGKDSTTTTTTTTTTAAIGSELPRASESVAAVFEYDGPIVIANTAKELDEAMGRIEAIRGDADDGSAAHCGFDMEWRVTFKKGAGESKTSLVQIAAASADLKRKVVVLARIHTAGLTRAFKRWCRDSSRGKTGFNARGDARKLARDHGVEISRVIELNALAAERFPGGCPSAPSWSLARLCEHVLGKTLPKDKTRMSNWEREKLNENQIKYAAMDAWASLMVYRALMRREVVETMGAEPYEYDPLPPAVVETSSDEDESEEDEEACAHSDDDVDDDMVNVLDNKDAKGDLTPQSAKVSGNVELTSEERVVYELHLSGMKPACIAKELGVTEHIRNVVMMPLTRALRKGCAFYYDLLDVPQDMTLWFSDFVYMNSRGPKMGDFTSQFEITPENAQIYLIMMALKFARDQERR
ncbi:Werner syndrome-like exonuclease [Ostreococcus tauri]|uniref:3'-5' exonuclease n=1 Tax=Ostreococcus tauri TaxID=70448 RepID=A0A1Y5I5Y9_OSTTA|nr:Werner syndrome-like exonuclease [Ostreococcus tauri]